jgi:peptidylprolyl isomerase
MVDAGFRRPPKELPVLNRRIRTVTIAALAGVLALSACGGSDTKAKPTALDQTTVSGGSDKEAPKVQIKPTPLKVTETQTRVVKAGDGAAVKGDEIVSLRYVLLNGKDGSQLDTNYGKANLGLNLADAKLLPGLKKGLANQKVGSRILVAMPPKDAFGEQGNANIKVGGGDTVVFLMDVVSATKPLKSAEGKAVNPPKNLPSVKVEEGKAATITIPKGQKPPANTVSQVLIEGKGPKVQAGQTIRVSYTGALWKNGKNFDSSANSPEGHFETVIGQKQVINAWDTQLVGKTVGSRLLLVVPPKDGYGAAGSPPKISGTDTLVFVVDILAAY